MLARDFAVAYHGAQLYGSRPYVEHLEDVVGVLAEAGYSEHQDIGFLHDVLEDTDATADMIRAQFGDLTADAVLFCTDAAGTNRKTRKQSTYFRVDKDRANESEAIVAGLAVKVADRIANLRNCKAENNTGLLSMYRKEHRDFERHYYDARHQSLWDLYDEALGD